MPFLASIFVHRQTAAVQSFNILSDQDNPTFLPVSPMNSQRLIDRNIAQLIRGRKLLQSLSTHENLSQKETCMGWVVKAEYTKIQAPRLRKTKLK